MRECLALLDQLADPLTAISNYVEAAFRLQGSDSQSAREKLGDVLDKCREQIVRANQLRLQLYDQLRDDERATGE
jgi:hypothetical protein